MNPNALIKPSAITQTTADETKAFRMLLCFLAAIVFVRLITLGAYPLFDNTEARYAYIGKLMYETGNWVTPMVTHGIPFWAKPPLSMWAVAISYSVFGVSEFSARFPFFVMFIATGWLVYAAAAPMFGRLGGLLSVVVFSSSGLSFYLAGGVMTDPALILGTTLIMVSFMLCMRGGHPVWGYMFFAGLAIALLAKGPIGAVLPGIAIGSWVLWHRKWAEIWRKMPWIKGTALTALVVIPWYVLAEIKTPGFLNYFIVGEHFQRYLDKGWHGDMYGAPRIHPLGTIWLFGLLAGLPWSAVLIFIGIKPNLRRKAFSSEIFRDEWVRYLVLWIAVTVLFFSTTHAVLITYVGMSIPGLAIFAGYVFTRLGTLKKPWLILTAAVVPLLLLATVGLYARNPSAAWVQTQVNTLAVFRAQTDLNKGRLIYYPFATHSVNFYGENEYDEAPDLTSLIRKIDDGEKYFAMHALRYSSLPENVRARFETVSINNATYLLKSTSGRSR